MKQLSIFIMCCFTAISLFSNADAGKYNVENPNEIIPSLLDEIVNSATSTQELYEAITKTIDDLYLTKKSSYDKLIEIALERYGNDRYQRECQLCAGSLAAAIINSISLGHEADHPTRDKFWEIAMPQIKAKIREFCAEHQIAWDWTIDQHIDKVIYMFG